MDGLMGVLDQLLRAAAENGCSVQSLCLRQANAVLHVIIMPCAGSQVGFKAFFNFNFSSGPPKNRVFSK